MPAPAPTPADWGRVDDEGTVSVREGGSWRVVGQYPDGSPAEALAYFRRKFDDLALRVRTLEQRHTRGGASATDLRRQASQLKTEVAGADAVGDLAGLEARLDALASSLAEATEEEKAAAKEAVDKAIADRTAIVENAEQLAARDPKSVQWKQAGAELTALFESWQRHQRTGPRLPRSAAHGLWKRFRDARSTFERNRRSFFAELDEVHKAAKQRKTQLVQRAEALTSQGEAGIPGYRALLDEWKAAGRAGRKADDALWARFKAAGDVVYRARSDRDAAEQEESRPRIEAREALLDEARRVTDEKDLRRARRTLTGIQRRWDEVGRIFPRDAERRLDDEMRSIEQRLRAREDVDWKRNNPETKARQSDAARQLSDAIERLETELAQAESRGDERTARETKDALEARRTWLQAIDG